MAVSFQLPFDGERFGTTSIALFAKRNRLRDKRRNRCAAARLAAEDETRSAR
jgi:hypothetical protein